MLIPNLDLLATAPGGVARLRELILTLAVQGKLVPQDPSEEAASELLKKIQVEKDRLIAAGKIKRDKPLKEIAKAEMPFGLPRGWEWVRLGQTMEMLNGKAFKPTEWLQAGLPIVRIQNLNKVDATFNYCDPERVIEKNLIDNGTFLISWSGTPGTSFGAFIWQRGPAALNQHIFKCELLGNAYVPEFLRLSINSQLNVLIAQAQGGVGLQHVTKGVLESLVLVLPPLAEQSRIVSRVEELMRLCDALEAKGQLEATQHAQLVSHLLGTLTDSETPEELAESWERIATHFDLLLDRPETVDALEQAILRLAVCGLLIPQDPHDEPASELIKKIRAEKDKHIAVGKLKREKQLPPITDDELTSYFPQGWKLVRMGDLIELVSGQHLGPSEYVEGLGASIPYLTGPAEFGAISPVPSRSTHERRAVAVLADILITVKGSGVGKLNVVTQDEIAISRQLMAIRPVLMNAEFLMIVLQTMALHFQEKSVGIAIPGIGREDVTHAQIGLPPLPEQSRIVSCVAQLRRLCSDLRQRLTAARERQSQLAQVLVEQQSTATI